jgi:4-amino-4-deoxy-L-arabinose transferase-like glycosyltransferase
VIFGVACIALIYLIGKQLMSRRAGLIAAALMAVSPLHINHSQEVRMYTLLTFCTLLSTYILVLLVREWSWKKGVGYVIAAYMALLTHPLTIFLFVPHGLYALLHWRKDRAHVLRVILCMLAAVLLWVPWLPQVMKFGDGYMQTQSWAEAEKLSPEHIPLLWGQFMYGEWNRLSYADKIMLRYMHYAYAAGVTLAVMGVWFAGRRRKEFWLMGFWALMPLVLMIVLSTMLDRAWPPRYLIYTSPAVFLLLSYPLARAPKKLVPVMLLILLALPAMRLQRYYENTLHPQWRQAAAYVENTASPSDTIYIYKPPNRFLFEYYHKGNLKWKTVGKPNPDGGIDRFKDRIPQRVADAVQPKHGRSWLMLSAVEENLPDDVEKELGRGGYRVERHNFYGIDILEVLQPQR